MKFYYSPLACSLADHVALLEAGIDFESEAVDLKTKTTASGNDFYSVTPKGYVPALVMDDGDVLTENIAVLDWIAVQTPHLQVGGRLGRTRVLEALTYISTEIHHGFKPMWHGGSDQEKVEASRTVAKLLQILADEFRTDYLFGNGPSVADFYLFVMLLWAMRFDIPVAPSLAALRIRMTSRPSVRMAMEREGLASLLSKAGSSNAD